MVASVHDPLVPVHSEADLGGFRQAAERIKFLPISAGVGG
jgi:hypothetical protein